MAGMSVRRAPCGPLGKAWNARVDDWMEDGSRIIRLSEEYRRHYRETVCARCTPQEQARRKCAALTEGCSTLSCSHMNRAFYSRYKRIIDAHQASHPLVERIALNARLEEGRKARAAPPGAAPGIAPAGGAARAGALARRAA